MSRTKVLRIVVPAVVVVAGVTAFVATRSTPAPATSPPNVTTMDFNNLRNGWDSNEPTLLPSKIHGGSFGQIFSTKLKGSIYSEPLVYKGTVLVTTENAYAYGLKSTNGKILWTRHFGSPFLASEIGCGDLSPDIGSTSTPVIDPSTGVVYMTTRLNTGSGGLSNSHWWLQALSVKTGTEISGYPVEIQGTPSNSPGVPFNDNYSMQRPGLLLLGGVVYMAFASDCDLTPYRGVVVGVSESTAQITTMWSDESGVGTDQDSQAGIWQSGGGLISDGSNQIILATGNGIAPTPSPGDTPPDTLSESVVRLVVQSNGQLTPTDYFSPSDAPTLDQNDEDLGSGGPIILPSPYFGNSTYPELLVEVGKDGRIFLLDAKSLGGREQGPGGTDDTLQTLGPFDGVWGHPAVFGGDGGWVYVLESTGGGNLRALSYGVNGSGVPELTSAATSTATFGYGSGSPIVTSNGTKSNTAVVWGVYENGNSGKSAQLRAYRAIPSNGTLTMLWSGSIGIASKFSVPTSYDGMIYVGNRSGDLMAFGMKSNAPMSASPVDFGQVPVGSSKTMDITVTANRSLTYTGVSDAQGVAAVGGQTGTQHSGPVPPGVQGSQGTSGSEEIGGPSQPFTINRPSGNKSIGSGESFKIPVTFSPKSAGSVIAEATIDTSAGTAQVALSGYGTAPGLMISAPPLVFGTLQTASGGKNLSLTFSNTWNRPETITGIKLPGSPFAVTGMPKVGTVLQPQQNVTVAVVFTPPKAGNYSSDVTISSDHGSVTVPMNGQAVTGQAHMTVSPLVLNFGSVKVGTSVTRSFKVTDTGNIYLTVSRAAPPAAPFTSAKEIPEGITLDPDISATQTITFAPTAPGHFTDQYRLNGSGGQGWISVELEGTAIK
jgi:HYDIN/CFA65/VesB-like, Ig-like domain